MARAWRVRVWRMSPRSSREPRVGPHRCAAFSETLRNVAFKRAARCFSVAEGAAHARAMRAPFHGAR
eukprot:7357715-Lingulodinium_polyedra.AAC.1